MAEKAEENNSDVPSKPTWNGPKVYKLPPDPTPMATQFIIQYTTGGEFFLSFFEETAHDVVYDGKEHWKFEDYTPVCISRISMSISRIPGLIKSLQDGLDKFKRKPEEGAKSEQAKDK